MLRRMASAIRHRGPDGYGIASGGGAGLVSTRLAIFDIPSGWQPMQGAHRDTVMVYNGEVFNHYELRQELEAQGERFRTTSDTEVLLRLLDRDGPQALHRCNGQWGIAHLDRPTRTLTLMRDRFGVRPLHYASLPDGGIVFSSEVKGILATGLVEATPDLEGIDEVITWCRVPSSPATWRWNADSSKSGSRKASENVRSWCSVCSTASAVVRLESSPPER